MQPLLFIHWDILLIASVTDGAPTSAMPSAIGLAIEELIERELLEATGDQIQITETGRRLLSQNPEQLDSTLFTAH